MLSAGYIILHNICIMHKRNASLSFKFKPFFEKSKYQSLYFIYIRPKVSNLSHTGDREALLKDIITHILSKTIQAKKFFKTNTPLPHPTQIKLIFNSIWKTHTFLRETA